GRAAVLVQGTSGGSIPLQLARIMGAQVIVTSSSNEKLARAKQLGATHGVNYKANPEWEKMVLELSDGHVDHFVEVGVPGTLAQSLRAIRTGGKITLIGVLSGAAEINPVLIFSRRAPSRFRQNRGNQQFDTPYPLISPPQRTEEWQHRTSEALLREQVRW